MLAEAFCPRCKEIVQTNDAYIVKGGESFHECRGELRWVNVKWKIIYEENNPEE